MPWHKQFDVDETLEKATEIFWTRGYQATSMRDLLDAMGIQKGSFYNAYGSKHEVYLKALEQYNVATSGRMRETTAGRSGLDALRVFFEAIYEDCISPSGHKGCMVINCALELAHHDREAQAIVKRAIAGTEEALRGFILDGQRSGEIRAGLDADATAKAMMSLIMGMRVYSRSGSDPGAVRTLANQAIHLVTAQQPDTGPAA
ncbi:MAG: TetR/AcrR family transcriptional regulator [Acidobacteriota bacterium]